MNHFGGNWTDQKMDIVINYAKAYLMIMKEQKWAKTIYFDGFAGSGTISESKKESSPVTTSLFGEVASKETSESKTDEVKKGTALRILEIVDPKPFDTYYFVEKDEEHYSKLRTHVKTNSLHNVFVVNEDCNKKLLDLAAYLKKNKQQRALAFIDPYGMSLKWDSITELKGLGIYVWILVPTGVGANRLLVNDGNIPESWLRTLESFLGVTREEIKKQFYRKEPYSSSLFGDAISTEEIRKEADTVNKLAKLYSNKLKEIFKFVSDPFVMRNSVNSIMYHFMMATNNPTALKIANEVIKPKYKI